MFLTSLSMKIKQLWEIIVYPSKYYAKKYAKKYAKEYSKKLTYHIETEDDSANDSSLCVEYSYNSFYENGNEKNAY